MKASEIKDYKEQSIPYKITKLKLLMRKCFDRGLRKAEIDVTPEQLQVLGLLLEKGACSMQEIAEEMVVDNSAVTRIVDVLEKKKFVGRASSKEDRRVKLVSVTRQGEQVAMQTFELAEMHKQNLRKGLTDEEVKVFKNVLDKMHYNIECLIGKEE